MSIEIRDARISAIVGSSVAFERIATGCLFTEGPLWHPREHYLLWSDMPDDHLRRWSPGDRVSTFRKPCNRSNGLTWDRNGRLLACEHASSHVTRTDGEGRIEPIATHYQGKELNSPNDIVCALDGNVYFTDPVYGRMDYYGIKRDCELDFRGLYRVGADPKTPMRIAADFGQPNGLCFSLDYRRLFVNDTERKHIRVFDVSKSGAVTGGAVWAETTGAGDGAPDGMKIDSNGNVYCCGPGGIHVFDPGAACLGVIHTPEYVTNMAWGDADCRSLYITASTSVYRMRVTVPGLPAL